MKKEEYEQHPIWSLLEQAQSHLDTADNAQKDNPLHRDAKAKISYLKWIFEQSDPQLTTSNELQGVQSQLQNITNIYDQSKQNANQLANADNHFNAIISQFPYPRIKKIFRSEQNEIISEFEAEIEEFRADIRNRIASLKNQTTEIEGLTSAAQSELNQLKNKIDQNDAKVERQFENWETKFSTEISGRLGELSEVFAGAQRERESHFSESIKRIEDFFDKSREELRGRNDEIRKFIEDEQERFNDWNEQAKNTSNDLLNEIKHIYNIAGQTALAGDFENAAKEEARLANLYSILAGICVILAPIALIYQWQNFEPQNANLSVALFKLSSVIAFFAPAALFGANSTRHRRVSVSLRSLGIRVATFDAYLANFDAIKRSEMKEKMAHLFFENNITPDRISNATKEDRNKLLDLAKDAFDRIEKLIEK